MIHIGIDWGTQSSKVYSFDDETRTPIFGRISDSALYYSKDHGVVGLSEDFKATMQRNHPGVNLSRSLPIKRQMISNPNAPMWVGPWSDTNLTFGGSIVLSLLGLLREALTNVGAQNRSRISEICFSFPNWSPEIDENHNQALMKFRSAARIAVLMALDGRYDSFIPQDGVSNEQFSAALESMDTDWQPPALEFQKLVQMADVLPNDMRMSFLPESIAAGLPYLVRLQRVDPDHAYRLLVVDVGAGSTDIGYITQNRQKRTDPFHVVSYKPAAALGIAGEAITDAVARHFGLNRADAESRKIQLSGRNRLHEEVPYVRDEWIKTIAERARDYVRELPHHVLMDRPEPVHIVITGGSGAVSGLAPALAECVKTGLRENRGRTAECPPESLDTNASTLRIFDELDQFETGRRSVSIGAGSPEKSHLSFV